MTLSPPDAPDQDGHLGPPPWSDPGAVAGGPAAAKTGRRWFTPVVLGVLVALIIGVIASSFITLPYYVIAPGSARPVDDLVRSTDRSKLYPHQGDVLFATLTEYRARPIDAVHSWFNGNIDLIPEKRILGNNTPQDLNKVDQAAMTDSKDTAVAVAMRRIGIKELGSGIQIDSVVDGSAAVGHLSAGDVVIAMDGKPTLLRDDLVASIGSHKPGEKSTLTVRGKSGTTRTETVTYGATKDDPTRAFLGVTSETKDPRFDVPYTVSIDSGSVVGPSAGLAFTLELIDSLTPGELTGGQKVAVTGTISPDGTVGPVGGVIQKTAAVKAAGAKYFLVPPDEFKDASAHAGHGLQVVQVTTLQDALDFLGKHGGDIAALPPAGTTPSG
jgi:PDZ domain-containing protein